MLYSFLSYFSQPNESDCDPRIIRLGMRNNIDINKFKAQKESTFKENILDKMETENLNSFRSEGGVIQKHRYTYFNFINFGRSTTILLIPNKCILIADILWYKHSDIWYKHSDQDCFVLFCDWHNVCFDSLSLSLLRSGESTCTYIQVKNYQIILKTNLLTYCQHIIHA